MTGRSPATGTASALTNGAENNNKAKDTNAQIHRVAHVDARIMTHLRNPLPELFWLSPSRLFRIAQS
jgi:hypothetical protein